MPIEMERQVGRADSNGAESRSLIEKLSVDNQAGDSGRKTSAQGLQPLQISDLNGKANATNAKQPDSEITFKVSPMKAGILNGVPGETALKLHIGGEIRKTGGDIELILPNNDKVTLDTKNGKSRVDSREEYQKEVHYAGSEWEETTLTSAHDIKITLCKTAIKSVAKEGVSETFPVDMNSAHDSEPPRVSSVDLSRIFKGSDRADLLKELKKVDREEGRLEGALMRGSLLTGRVTKALSEDIKHRAILTEKAAELAPREADILNISSENQLRIALRNMRDQYGIGSPQTKDYAAALQRHLQSNHNPEQNEEIRHLGFEIKKAGK